jgi:hypothetical protein
MLRKIFIKALGAVGLVALVSLFVLAQDAGPRIGIFVTPVPNAPLSATTVFERKRPLQDGTTESFRSISNIARDSSGRIYNELRQLVPLTFTGTPQLFSSHIYDPATRLNTFLSPAQRIARQSKLPGAEPEWERTPALPSAREGLPNKDPLLRQQDLGTQVMEDVTVHGARVTLTVPANLSGTGQPVVVTNEYWYSDDLHLYMLIRHADPRIGEQTVTVTQLKRGEPDPQIFTVPSDYKLVDETPPAR